jgi:hypothetical protein
LLEPAPLEEMVAFDLDPVVQVSDLGAAFLEEGGEAVKSVTPVALRAPEVVLWDPGVRLGRGR